MEENGNGNGNGHRRELSKREKDALAAQKRKEAEIEQQVTAPPIIFEPRCHCCTSPYRNFIDALLVKGASYSSISEKVPGEDGRKIDRRSVSLHSKEHLGYQQDALRKVLEEEADFQRQNYEEGIRGAFTHRGLLEVTLRKFQEDLMAGNVSVEARDALAVVQTLEKLNGETEAVAIDEMREQVDALVRAIKEEADLETGRRIAMRAESIYKSRNKAYQLPISVESAVDPVEGTIEP